MTTRADVDLLKNAGNGVVALAQRDLSRFWDTLDLTKPDVARDELLRFVPTLVSQYGDVAASVAAEWYENVRSAQVGDITATTVNLTNDQQIQQSVRFFAGDLFTDNPASMLALLGGAVQRYVMASQRGTIAKNVQIDPAKPRYARVPTGAKTCAWCTLLASRGFAYLSRSSAGATDHFHDHDDCQIVAEWDQEHHIDGYDPDALQAQYRDARNSAEAEGLPLDDKTIAAQLRTLYPNSFSDSHVSEH